MRVLRRKAIRDMWGTRALFLTMTLLLALGVGIFVTMYSAFLNLELSEGFTYEELKFADVFYRLEPVSERVATRVERIEGVAVAEGRYVADVPMPKPRDPGSTLVARLISLPEEGRPQVNDIEIRQGRFLADGVGDSILIDEMSAVYYDMEPGDSVSLRVFGKDTEYDIAGTFTSPEYIWKAKSAVEPFTAGGEFAVVMARKNAVSDLLGVEGLINEINVIFEPDADPDATIERLDGFLKRYGENQKTERQDQISYALLELDLEGFSQIAVIVPVLFLIIAAMVIYVSLTRTVQAQRPIIGLMRAEGFSHGQILRHYLTFTLFIAAAGGTMGVLLGIYLGAMLTRFYVSTIGIPYSLATFQPSAVAIGLIAGFVICILAGLLPALNAAGITPAEAMRSGVSLAGNVTLMERLVPIRQLPYVPRLALRNMTRSLRRTFASIFGLMMAVALVLAAVGMLDTMNRAFDVQFDEIQRYDLKVIFTGLENSGRVDVYQSWPEVQKAEPIAEIPVEIKHNGESRFTVITALRDDSTLLRPSHVEGADPLSSDGLFLTDNLAKALKVSIGDTVEVESELRDESFEVVGIVKQPLSTASYVRLSQARVLLRGDHATGGLIKLHDAGDMAAVEERLNDRPYVLDVEQKDEVRRSFEELMSLFYEFLAIFAAFGIILGGFAVFNTITINVRERSRELATMLTLGFSRLQVDALLTVENVVTGVVGILLGFVLGYGLAVGLMSISSGEDFTLDTFISPLTYVLVGLAALAVILASQIPGLLSLNRIDLAEAVKERIS